MARRVESIPRPGTGEPRSARRIIDAVRLVLAVVALMAVMAAPATAAVDLERVTVAELQVKMATGELTSVELTKAY
jgi:hypothetical protein